MWDSHEGLRGCAVRLHYAVALSSLAMDGLRLANPARSVSCHKYEIG